MARRERESMFEPLSPPPPVEAPPLLFAPSEEMTMLILPGSVRGAGALFVAGGALASFCPRSLSGRCRTLLPEARASRSRSRGLVDGTLTGAGETSCCSGAGRGRCDVLSAGAPEEGAGQGL